MFQSWLLARFDDLTLKEILAMLGEQLEDLGEALLDFTAPADLDAWLGEHPQPSKAE